jgi:hypothetical protein
MSSTHAYRVAQKLLHTSGNKYQMSNYFLASLCMCMCVCVCVCVCIYIYKTTKTIYKHLYVHLMMSLHHYMEISIFFYNYTDEKSLSANTPCVHISVLQ